MKFQDITWLFDEVLWYSALTPRCKTNHDITNPKLIESPDQIIISINIWDTTKHRPPDIPNKHRQKGCKLKMPKFVCLILQPDWKKRTGVIKHMHDKAIYVFQQQCQLIPLYQMQTHLSYHEQLFRHSSINDCTLPGKHHQSSITYFCNLSPTIYYRWDWMTNFVIRWWVVDTAFTITGMYFFFAL